jgi:hypothetical protein
MAEIANLQLDDAKRRLAMMIGPAATDTDQQSCAVATRQSAAASLFAAGKPGQAIRTTMEVEAKWCERWRLMDDGQRYRDQSSQPVRALLGRRRRAESRKSTRRRSKQSARRAPRRAPRTSSTRRLLAPQFAKRLANRGFQ